MVAITLGEIEIETAVPELNNIISGVFGKSKGVRIKFQEIAYGSILICGMVARITR